MAAKTYKLQAFVLKKTKLGEKDLIVSMVDSRGMLVQGVAKGARKPGGSHAARLELFSQVDVLMAQGRSLDVICEARVIEGSVAVGGDLVAAACAAPVAELLCLLAQPELEQPRLYGLAQAAFGAIGRLNGEPDAALAVTSAALWKALALAGFRPSFSTCALCGKPLESESAGKVAFSPEEGGLVCGSCQRPADALLVDAATIRWCDAFMRSPFSEVAGFGAPQSVSFDTIHLARLWIQVHVARNLKSLDFLFASGLF